MVDMGGFGGGREISKGGTRDLPLGPDSITGFTIVSAASLDDAERLAQGNPFISSIRVYEVRSAEARPPYPLKSYCLLRWSPICTSMATHSG